MTDVSGSRRLMVAVVTASGAAAFAASLLWAAYGYRDAFANVPGPWSLGAGATAVVVNTAWFTLFAVHHSVFARQRVRDWAASVVSPDLERSVYVWTASVLLASLVWRWSPVPGRAWHATGLAGAVLFAVQLTGVALTLVSARQLGLSRLSGLRVPGSTVAPAQIRSTGLYGFVRHPIYFAWILMVWPVPAMTGSRLTFAVLTTLYLIVAIPLEERTLRQQLGPAYDEYRRRVRWRMLPGLY